MRKGLARRVIAAVVAAGAVVVIGPSGAGAGGNHGGGGGGGGGGGTTGVPASAFSGHAYVAKADVTVLGGHVLVGPVPEAGPLPSTGGFDHDWLIKLTDPAPSVLFLDGEVASAATGAAGDQSNSSASVAELSVGLGDYGSKLLIEAAVLRSQAHAKCTTNGPVTSGSSQIVALKIKRLDLLGIHDLGVVVGTAPNQRITIDGLAEIILNEQITSPGAITVNALHVKVNQATFLTNVLSADVVISSAHADVQCPAGPPPPPPPCPVKDFVTGGGYIVDTQGNKITFSVVGGQKPNGLSGHLNIVDHGSGEHVKAGDVTGYSGSGNTRTISYSGDVDGAPANFVVTVTDNGEPGTADTFSISGGYTASGVLQGGNIQLHHPGACETAKTKGRR